MRLGSVIPKGVLMAVALAAALAAEERAGFVVLEDVMVPMRDGVRLATRITLPSGDGAAQGRFPVILERTPYDKAGSLDWAEMFVSHGYAFVSQDVRGRYGSEGRWRPNRDDGNDGYDTAKWIGEQPWFQGGIGTVGVSYPGGTQHALALANPPHLAALVPIDSMSDYGRYGIRHNGAFELRFFNWIFQFGFAPSPVRQPGVDPAAGAALGALRDQVVDYVRHLPLRRGTTPLALAPDYEDFLVEGMRHGGNDSFWRDMGASVVDHLADYKDVPVYHVGGWYDSWAAQTANLNYVELCRTKKSLQRLVMGPWTHGGQGRSFAGEAEFGPEAALDMGAFHRRWFDRWLKGVDNGVDREPPVRIFVMGGGDGHKTADGRLFVGGYWRDENEWPLARALAAALLPAGGRTSVERAAPGRGAHPVPLRPQGARADPGRQHLFGERPHDLGSHGPGVPPPRAGLRGPSSPERTQRRARVPDASPRRGHGGHGPPGGEALDQLVGARHGLHGQAGRRLAGES